MDDAKQSRIIAILLIIRGIAITFVIENKKLYQTMAKIVIEAYNPRMR